MSSGSMCWRPLVLTRRCALEHIRACSWCYRDLAQQIYSYCITLLALSWCQLLTCSQATCFAYGQTGSGKTYTMQPLPLRAAADIFRYSVQGRTFPLRFCHLSCLHLVLLHAPQPPAELQLVKGCRLPAFLAQQCARRSAKSSAKGSEVLP